tara:strand:+ start:430 stop:1608 length:1179 start_codon:yes stop_codon:yes gene_type:complete
MSTIKVNKITSVAGTGSVEAEIPIKLKEASEPSYPSDGGGETHGILFVDSADDALKYRHKNVNGGNSVTLSSTGVALGSTNTFTRGQVVDGGTDMVQLRIESNGSLASAQSNNLFEITTSTNTEDLLTVSGDGNLRLHKDSSTFKMGADAGFVITHDGDTGATIAGSPITITAAEASTWSTSDGALTISGKTGLNLQEDGATIMSIDTSRNVIIGNATSSETIRIGHSTSETTVGDNLTVSGNLQVNGILDNTTLQSYKETIVAVTNAGSGATVTFDMDAGNIFASMGSNAIDNTITTLVFEGMTSGQSATWIVENDGTTDITFATVKRVDSDGVSNETGDIGKFPSGQEPVHTTSDEAISMYTFFAHDTDGNGTVDSIYVMVGGLNFAVDS